MQNTSETWTDIHQILSKDLLYSLDQNRLRRSAYLGTKTQILSNAKKFGNTGKEF